MIRFTKALVAAAALLVVPTVASAISITIVGASESIATDGILYPGETITFDLRMTDNVAGPDVFGLEAAVTGYDAADVTGFYDSGIAHQSGTVVDQTLGIDLGSGPQFGLSNAVSASEENWEANQFNPVAHTTTLFGGISATAVPGDGTADLGIAGNPIASDLHFQVTFANVVSGAVYGPTFSTTANLSFDVTVISTGGASSTTSTPFSITVVPEPGTALLMGLGRVGLATTRRR